MTRHFVADEQGQALAIVGLALVVLLGALALSIDWGYGYATRRATQNQADAAALAVGRRLATSYTAGDPEFRVSQEDAWTAACNIRNANVGGTADPQTLLITVAFLADLGDSPLATASFPSADCSTTGATTIPTGSRFVRIESVATYASLFGIVTRQQLRASATAVARLTAGVGVRPLQLPPGEKEVPGIGLSGLTTAPNAALWPIAYHYEPADFGAGNLVTLWPLPSKFGTFQGLVSLAHNSLREPGQDGTHQLISETDYRGTPDRSQGHPLTPPLLNASFGCGTYWDTKGSRDPAEAIDCDLPNWFYYGFGGSVSVGTDWAAASWDAYRGNAELPDPLDPSPIRSSCDNRTTYSYFPAPSCTVGASTLGDWAETVAGAPTAKMAAQMREFIKRYGRDVPGSTLGKAVVVHILLWDCAEHFDGSQPAGSRWSLIARGGPDNDPGDCSRLVRNVFRKTSVDRVHIFTAVPMTFYLDLVAADASRIQAYAGDIFGDAGSCAPAASWSSVACQLNPLVNSAFLVPDE